MKPSFSSIVLIANVLSLIGQFFSLYSSTRKTKKEILIYQCVTIVFSAMTNFLLKGYSGLTINFLALTRNLLTLAGYKTDRMIPAFIILAMTLGTLFNRNGYVGYLPIVSNVVLCLVILNTKVRTRTLQIGLSISNSCWLIFDLAISNYVGAGFDAFAVISYLINIVRNNAEDDK